MILDEQQIRELIVNNPGKARVLKGQQYSNKLCRHLYGKNLDSYLEQIDGFERPSVLNLRKKYAKSNKDLFARLSRPLDKVFTARGGSMYLSLPEAKEKQARVMLTNVRDGLSARKWIETFWKPHTLDDPFGVIFLEIAEALEAVQLRQKGKSFVIPTYKSIHSIYDYLPKGNRCEYIIFELTGADKERFGVKEERLFRVVDDATDYLVTLKDQTATILTQFTMPNFFGEVPAMINSDIQDPQNEHCTLSLFDEVLELAEQFLLKGSIRVAHDFMHGFPKYAEFASDCPDCGGEKVYEGKKCETCGGSGKKATLRVSDVKLLEWPTKDDQVILPNQVGGYISPDQIFYEISTADLQDLENAMVMTLWGTQSRLKTQGMATDGQQARTATEVMDEIKPQADRLVPVSEMAETREKFIIDAVIRLNLAINYQGAAVTYGRRYLLENPDAIWEKYSDARVKGAPQSVLDTLLNEYYEANYQSDPVGLAVAKKLMYVEPFVHLTAVQLKALTPDPLDYKAKLYFSEWLATISEAAILALNVDELKTQLAEYAGTKNIPEPAQPQPVAA